MIFLVRSKRLLGRCAAALWTKAVPVVLGLLLLPLFAAGRVAAGVLSLLAPGVLSAIEAASLLLLLLLPGVDRNAAAGEDNPAAAAGDPSVSIALRFFHGLLLAGFAGHAGWGHGNHGGHEVLDQLVGGAFGAAKRHKRLAAGEAIGFDVGTCLVQLCWGKGVLDLVALALVALALHGAGLQTALRRRFGAVDAAQTDAGAVGTDLVPVRMVKLVEGLGCLAAVAGACRGFGIAVGIQSMRSPRRVARR